MSSDSEIDEEFANASLSDSDLNSEPSERANSRGNAREVAAVPRLNSSDEDNEANAVEVPQREMRRGGDGRQNRAMVLRDFFRLIAGPRLNVQETAADNTELVNILKELHVVRSTRVERSLLMCPRGAFIPPEYAEEAYSDTPIRVEDMEFNISAPHMHATCLEALELQSGEKFLDVGSGCGIVAACAAFLVGKQGEVIGAEIKQQILEFSESCIEKLRQDNPLYAQESCEIKFVLKNAFMPMLQRDYFDKIHVGGTCPEDRLTNLVTMLNPNGGKMTVPVGQELRLITRNSDRKVTQRVLTQVRFSDLTVPSDADIVLSTMNSESEEKMIIPVPPSTLQEDTILVRNISGVRSEDADLMEEDSIANSPIKLDMKDKVRRSISSLLGLNNNNSSTGSSNKGVNINESEEQEDVCLDLVHFAEPDCMLVGENWTLSSHRAVLKARCEYFRARFDSNMQDACDDKLSVPVQFSQDAISLFLQYIYKDELPDQLTPQTVIDVLHIACYYGVPRLVVLCEHLLAEELKSQHIQQNEAAAEFGVKLLTLADTNGLRSLQKAVVQYIVKNYNQVSQTEAYGELSKREVDLIMKESFALHQRFETLLTELSETMEFTK
eukprot:g8273.t1